MTCHISDLGSASDWLKQMSLSLRQDLSEAPPRYSHTLPIRICATQRGRDFEAPDLERGSHFRGVF